MPLIHANTLLQNQFILYYCLILASSTMLKSKDDKSLKNMLQLQKFKKKRNKRKVKHTECVCSAVLEIYMIHFNFCVCVCEDKSSQLLF